MKDCVHVHLKTDVYRVLELDHIFKCACILFFSGLVQLVLYVMYLKDLHHSSLNLASSAEMLTATELEEEQEISSISSGRDRNPGNFRIKKGVRCCLYLSILSNGPGLFLAR